MSTARPTTARLFLALWPGPRIRAALGSCRDAWIWNAPASLVRTEQLHLTLHFLGDVPCARLSDFTPRLRAPFRPFELRLGRPQLWPHGIAVLEPNTIPARLLELHASLQAALQSLDLPTDDRAFRPHVTLARRAGQAVPPAEPGLVRWRVSSYALVQSMGDYRVLQRYA